jgi:tetratricopeptide (TPR) repeat protein
VSVTTKADGFSYRSAYALSGPQLTAEQEIVRTARTLPASAFSAYAAFAAAIDADRAQPLKLAASIAGTPAIPANATAAAVYNAALSAYNAKRYEAAAALWKRTTEIDPKMGDAWVSLGLVYEKLERDDEAAAAIQKQIELDPYNKRAYGDLGYVLKQGGKDEEAIKAYAKHVELNPVDADGFTQLGTLQHKLGRFAEAAPALEKASALGKPNAWTLVLLGSAYLRLDKRENALQAFDRAVTVEGSPRIWTKIGWSLADAGIELERAANLASRTVSRVLDETKSLTLGSARNRHLYLMGNLAWAWDTLGLVNLQKGNLADADKYARAAWLLEGHWQMAEHVGRIYEKQGRQAEALNYYLTAKAGASKSGPSLAERTKSLTKDTPSDTLTRVSRTMSLYRMALVEEKGMTGDAHFVAIVGEDRHAIDVKFVDGDPALERLDAALKRVTYTVEFPTSATPRLILPLVVRCDPAAGCAIRIARADDVNLERK